MTRGRFALGIFLGASLLFTVQPIAARLLLPLLGGAPAVWIVCSLCFQAILLAGYGYAHVLGARATVRTQVLVHLALLAVAFLALPISVDETLARTLVAKHPTVGILLLLVRAVGLPFFVLSTTSPLLQRWFAEQGEPDPYHLYAASNAGSMLALASYPFLVEPLLGITAQGRAFHLGYALYAVLVVVCAATTVSRARASTRTLARTPPPPAVAEGELPLSGRGSVPATEASRWRQRLTWIALSFVPSSLLLGATEFVTTDVASVPLLWLAPLQLYLASFIVAFAKRSFVPLRASARFVAVLAPMLLVSMSGFVRAKTPALLALHLGFLFAASVLCHQALAARRPSVARLTEFYLLLSVGGVLGGAFNGLVAPAVFDDMREYPIAIVLACVAPAIAPVLASSPRREATNAGRAASVLAAIALLAALAVYGIGVARPAAGGRTIWKHRGFFGVVSIVETPAGVRRLFYGRALHGAQDGARRTTPLGPYHATGPVGDVLGGRSRGPRVGVIGLGVGALAAYARPGDAFTFFDIDPEIVKVARERFDYLRDAERRARVDVEIGDARLLLRDGAAARFDVVVLDALTSDAVPVHLLTREALAVYRRALAPGGVLVANVSNPHVVLAPPLAAAGAASGMRALLRDDAVVPAELAAERTPSRWLLLGPGEARPGWTPVAGDARAWTDDYANVLAAMRF